MKEREKERERCAVSVMLKGEGDKARKGKKERATPHNN